MPGGHLTLGLLRAVQRKERDPSSLAKVALGHLLDICPQCRRVFLEWGDVEAPEGRTAAPIGNLARDLLGMAPEERCLQVRRQPSRYGQLSLAELLLRQARRALPGKLEESCALASLARAVVEHSSLTPETAGIYSRALGYEGNAHRAMGRIALGQELIETARFALKAHAPADVWSEAVLDGFEGVLRRLQGRFDEAEILANRAVDACEAGGLATALARNLISLAVHLRERGDLERALEVIERAESCLPESGRVRRDLLAHVRHNQAVFFHLVGEVTRARDARRAARALQQKTADPMSPLRMTWHEGSVAEAAGDLGTAEARFLEARSAFLRMGVAYQSALVGKDLAALYSRQSRIPEVETLVEEIVPIFEAQEVYFEADAARKLLRDALGDRREVN